MGKAITLYTGRKKISVIFPFYLGGTRCYRDAPCRAFGAAPF